LQTSFGVNMLALVNGEPVTLGLRRALVVYIEHRFEVLTRRTQYPVGQGARTRAHPGRAAHRPGIPRRSDRTIRQSDSAEAARTR
jgi:DNA gyrase subunit A